MVKATNLLFKLWNFYNSFYYLGKVLQGRSKLKYIIYIIYIIKYIFLFDSSVFLGLGFHDPNYLVVKQILFTGF